MIDFKEIQKKYPKAWKKVKDYFLPKGLYFNNTNDRMLFPLLCFFDDNGIYIESNRDVFSERPFWCKVKYTPALPSEIVTGAYRTRTPATEAAIIKAFSILENQLNK